MRQPFSCSVMLFTNTSFILVAMLAAAKDLPIEMALFMGLGSLFVGGPDCGNHWWRVGRLAFRHHGNMDNGCYREFDHGDRGGDCFAGDCFVVQ